jgi:hypothetical protein
VVKCLVRFGCGFAALGLCGECFFIGNPTLILG